MKFFKWNEPKDQIGGFWDANKCEVDPYYQEIRSDKSMVNNPGGFELRIAIESLCRVVSELVKLEEDRENEHNEENNH